VNRKLLPFSSDQALVKSRENRPLAEIGGRCCHLAEAT
jgi:hypothetical protein